MEPWPPVGRDETDPAVAAARIIRIGNRLRLRVRKIAKEGAVPADLIELLLVFVESNGTLRVSDLAELLGVDKGTASRLATRAEQADLVDKLPSPIDSREVSCRLSPAGRDAVNACVDALRPHAQAVLQSRPTRPTPRTYNRGWRAGDRAGMPKGA